MYGPYLIISNAVCIAESSVWETLKWSGTLIDLLISKFQIYTSTKWRSTKSFVLLPQAFLSGMTIANLIVKSYRGASVQSPSIANCSDTQDPYSKNLMAEDAGSSPKPMSTGCTKPHWLKCQQISESAVPTWSLMPSQRNPFRTGPVSYIFSEIFFCVSFKKWWLLV